MNKQEQVGFTKPNIIDDWLDKNGSLEIAKQVEEEAKELCKKQTFSEEEVLDLMYYIRCNAIEVDTGWQINGGFYYTDKELLEQFKKK
jgi:hypothetical protein